MYNVTFKGAGYRTCTVSVNLDNDKTVTVWNNVLDTPRPVVTATVPEAEEADSGSDPRTVTFLAGDIALNNSIDIYDLSAVVSYFGVEPENDWNSKYARYDLNRDGNIDSRDIAMVLVSWGK